jgi:hypothetical protein
MVAAEERASMAKTEQIYRRTEAGLRACEMPDSGLHAQQRRILGLLSSDTHSDFLRSTLGRRFGDRQVGEWLADLQARGFIEADAVSAELDLDFTGSLSLADLARQGS